MTRRFDLRSAWSGGAPLFLFFLAACSDTPPGASGGSSGGTAGSAQSADPGASTDDSDGSTD
ncbi:MAG TPA: hypothetical protein VGC79_06610, partial [Polyangiaceae bacterium]